MKKQTHSLHTRLLSMLLALVCVLGLLPTAALAASPDTIKLEDCAYNGVHYNSPALGECWLHQMQFSYNGDSVMGFCSQKGAGMGRSLEGHTWDSPTPINDPTVKTMMAYFYCHSKGIFTDQAVALGSDEVWGSEYTWTMNAWVQAVVWRYKAGLLSDPAAACAEELLYVYNNLYHTSYSSIDEEMDGISFRDRAQYILDLGAQGVWGDCAVYEYTYAGPGTSYHPANDVQSVVVGELTITREQYELTIRKVDATNPSKGLSGARFLVQNVNGSYSKEVVTGSDGTVTLSPLDASTYAVTELSAPEGYEIDNAGPQYVVLPNESGTTVTVTFTNTPEITSEGSIRKVDADDPTRGLAGAVIKIEGVDNSFTGTYTTGAGGYLTDVPWDAMPIGSYVATEVTPPSGYTTSSDPNKVRQEFVWDGQHDVDLIFENDAKVKIELRKVDDSDRPIEGAVFNILKDGQIIGSEATDASGIITVTGLPVDSYEVTEKSVPDPYVVAAEPTQTIWLGPGDDQQLIFDNLKQPQLTIAKVDAADSTTPIPGTVFRIEGVDSDYVNTVTTGQDGTVTLRVQPGTYKVVEQSVPEPYYLPDKDADREQTISLNAVDAPESYDFGEILTDANGEIRLHAQGQRLYPGEYTITETAPASGFQMKEPTTQKVILHGGETKTVTFENVPLNAIIVEKYESVTGAALPGATFQLRLLGGTSGTGGTVIGQKTTGKNGAAIWTGLTAGTYILEEVDPADGYSIIQASETVYLADSGEQSVITVRFENMPDGNLLIRKVCATNPSVTLPNAEFKVMYADGTLIGDSNGIYRTDENGEILISGLTPGKSVVVTETRAPDGFLIDTQSQTVQIKEGRTVSLTFKNQPKGELIIQKRDSATGQPMAGAEFRVTTAAGCEVGLDGVIGDSSLTQNGIFTTNSNGEYITDENGRIVIDGLTPGVTVTAREVKALEGYVLDTSPKSIIIKAGEVQTLRFYNEAKGTLVIRKLDSMTKEPLAGVEFELTYADGGYVDDANGHLSSKGLYTTDANGEIRISGVTGTIVVKETKTVEGYTIDEATRVQTVQVNPADTQTLTFYNDPIGGVEIIKVNAADTKERIPNVTFEIRKVDDELIDTVTTDKNGRVFTALEDGAYYAVEIEAAESFKLDDTPHYFEVEDGKTTTLRIENDAFSGILIKKIDSSTREGIYGVTFLLYDSNKNPIGQYTSDDRGYVYIDDLPSSGRYYLRELEAADGYLLDEQLKTVYVTAGTTTEVIWENTAVTGQIQVTKTSADYNSMNGWPAGTPIPNTEFEIYNARTGKLVDTIKTDKNGVAVSRPLPLARYKIVESKAADFYGLDQTPIEVEIEYAGQIVRAAMTNKSLYTNVSIKKTGYTEVMPGQQIRYDFSGIANNSTTSLTSFFWRGTLPTQAVRLDKIVTGTYNVPGNYKVVYKTNLNPNYRTMYDNLSTQQNYVLDASPAALGLASNEVITEFMVVFGVVPANFRQVEAPQVYCNVVSWLTGGTQFVNQADVGGIYNGQWIMAASRWVTKVYKPAQPLPRTGY